MNTIDVEFIEKLLDASHCSSFECAQKITDTLVENLPIRAASFYSYFSKTEILSLRAQTGFRYSDYSSFELPLHSIPGQAISGSQIIQKGNIEEIDLYRDKMLIWKYDIEMLTAIPISSFDRIEFYTQDIHQKYLGVICLFHDDKINIKELNYLSSIIGKVYTSSVVNDKTLIRADIEFKAIQSRDLNSFLHKVLSLLSKQWRLEASSAFVYNEHSETIYMRGTTGLETNFRLIECIYRINEINANTVKCFHNNLPITIISPRINNSNGRYPESVRDEKKSLQYVPISEPVENINKKEVVGVLRSINRIVSRGSVTETCHHGWEDASLLFYVAEVIGVILHLFRRTDDISLNFERAMHGINKPIKASKIRLCSIYNSTCTRSSLLSKEEKYYLESAIASINSLEWQVQKHTNREGFSEKNKIGLIKIFETVIAETISFIESTHRTYNVKRISIPIIKERFTMLPEVHANGKALLMVFRNLVENAMKYHIIDKVCSINFEWESRGKYIYVKVSDNGMGVSHLESKKIFREGYRGIDAIRREPVGTGIGLSDSKSIMQNMRGDLYLENCSCPTVFVVKLLKQQKDLK